VTIAGSVSLAALAADPHAIHHRLRAQGPVVWVPAIKGWMVIGRDVAVEVMRDAETFTVDDPRFSTAQVVGPSMLSTDGLAHDRHRAPFLEPYTARRVDDDLGAWVDAEANRLVRGICGEGDADLASTLAAPLAVTTIVRSLGLIDVETDTILSWYAAIVDAVQDIAVGTQTQSTENGGIPGDGDRTGAIRGGEAHNAAQGVSGDVAGEGSTGGPTTADSYAARTSAGHTLAARPVSGVGAGESGASAGYQAALDAFAELSVAVKRTIAAGGRSLLAGIAGRELADDEIASNVAVIMFGAIETSEGATANALLQLLTHRQALDAVRHDRSLLPDAVEEAFRIEPAATSVDRYATRDARVGDTAITAGDYVSVSLAAANRDPAVFVDPDRFDIYRENVRRHATFAYGPHACLGIHLARIETTAVINAVLEHLPNIELDRDRTRWPRGLVFRKPAAVHAHWSTSRPS